MACEGGLVQLFNRGVRLNDLSRVKKGEASVGLNILSRMIARDGTMPSGLNEVWGDRPCEGWVRNEQMLG